VTLERVAPHLRALYDAGTPIIGICAAGILIRALAPVLGDKTREPPVLALAEDGSAVIPLLGGHRGANRLACTLADALGIEPALTTASELAFGAALDDPPDGYALATGSDVKAVSGALLANEPVALAIEAGEAGWLHALAARTDASAHTRIMVTDRVVRPEPGTVVLRPRVLAIGVGCVRDAKAGSVVALIEATLAEVGLAEAAIGGLFSLDLKQDEPALHAAAVRFGVPFRVFDAATLAKEEPRLASPSEAVERAVGVKSVAEASALAAAGRDGTLIVAKRRNDEATCAIARAAKPIDAATIGRGRGGLAVIGIGPGAAAWRTPEATAALAEADDIVGYSLYLDLLGPLARRKARHDFALGEEEARARAALDLAAQGRRVALVSSGDAGVYGMAAVALEVIEKTPGAYRGVDFRVLPGVSAMHAAAARIGAPLGHDFCAISLSDRLTPLAVIEQRLAAAIEGDFVIALFNPVATKRRAPFERALKQLRAGRKPDCPVIVARAVGRADERVTVTTLETLETNSIDMLSLVIVGNSASRRVRHNGVDHVLTPRGYRLEAKVER
jgi:cobalt-precorrin 5A hydrolase/precorrin-3B C17-methyltransferase